MRRKKRYGVGILLSAMLLLWSPGDVACAEGRDVMQQNLVRMQTGEQKQQGEISAETVSRMDADHVTVTTPEGFMDALRQRKSQIVVDGSIVIDNGAEASGRMRPVMIPGGTVISGTTGSSINSRSPIQIEGDVAIRDIRLVFSSSNALGSVPHREIFLAGYGLTLDNVSTYLEGGDSSLGGLGGTEKELLPTIYAGGYPGTAVGTQASLTLQNSNSQTMFQGIYLGHGAGNDQKVPYSGAAVFNMDCSVIVRDGVYARENDAAGINVTGNGYAKTKAFYGNSNTTLTIREASVETAVVEQVGRIVLDDNATLAPQTADLNHVSLKNNACLDLNGILDPVVQGGFEGGDGLLVLNAKGMLDIGGPVTGTTVVQLSNRNVAGNMSHGKVYITAVPGQAVAKNFVLSQKHAENGFSLVYKQGQWTAYRNYQDELRIGSIEAGPGPGTVDLNRIWQKTDEGLFCDIVWRDENGAVVENDVVEDEGLYDAGYVVAIRTDYWESESPDVLEKVDWYNYIFLVSSDTKPGRYYFRAEEGAQAGDYTFLFCSEWIENELMTVADVKALKGTVKASIQIHFTFSPESTEKPEQPEEKPTEPPEEKPEPPVHVHQYAEWITKEATCTDKGIRTYQCSGCNDRYTREIPMISHQTVTDPAKEATCTETGKTKGSHCAVCGAVISAQQTVPKKEHRFQTQVKKAKPGADGSTASQCRECGIVSGRSVISQPKTIKLSADSYTYNGKQRKPSVKVTDKNGKVINSRNYTVSYGNHKNVGNAVVTVRFKGNYEGTLKKTFTIVPKTTDLKLTPKKKSFTVKWKKQGTQTDGYVIEYSTSSRFTKKTTSSVKVANKNTTSKTVKKVRGNKKYYVRICTYKVVRVNGKKITLRSEWSKVRTVKPGK